MSELRRGLESPISEPHVETGYKVEGGPGQVEEGWVRIDRQKPHGLVCEWGHGEGEGLVRPAAEWVKGGWHEGSPPKAGPEDRRYACEAHVPRRPRWCSCCDGNGYVMIQVGDFAGHERRERCAACNGVGAKRCNAEGRAGDLCKLEPGHEGAHASERGVVWSGGLEAAVGPWWALKADGLGWRWERADNGATTWGEPVESDHYCGPSYPPAPDRGGRYAIFCGRDKVWRDVTNVVVRGFVVPYEEHVVIPTAKEEPAAQPRPSSDPEPLGDIVSRILKDLRALVRVASK